MNRRMLTLIGGGILVLLLVVGVIFYVMSRSKPEVVEEEREKADVAPPPLDIIKGSEDVMTSKALVSDKAMKERKEHKLKEYLTDPKLPAGTLRGVCFVPFDKDLKLWPRFPVELTGEKAIKDPVKGEKEYYQRRQPYPSLWLGSADQDHTYKGYDSGKKRYPVKGAVITIRGVEAGRRGRLDRISFFVDQRSHDLVVSRPQGETVVNDSWHTIGVMPVMQPVQFVNFDLFDCRYLATEVTRGEVVFDELLKGYNDASFPGEAFGTNLGMKPPLPQQTRPIRRTGIYAVACQRHPWQKSYLVIADNPYVTVSKDAWGGGGSEHFSGGEFIIKDIPPGKHTVEVWHPEYTPVQKTFEIEISHDKTTELPIEFRVPPTLAGQQHAYPTNNIVEWAFAGPFEAGDDETDQKVRKCDFGARYKGLKGTVAWYRVAGTSLSRIVDKDMRDVACFFAATLVSPQAQRIAIGSICRGGYGGVLGRRIWVNGNLINYTEPGEFFWGDALWGNMISTVDLKAGENTLLVRVAAGVVYGNPQESFFAVSVPDGIQVKAPEAVKGGPIQISTVDVSPIYPRVKEEPDKAYDPEIAENQDKVEWKAAVKVENGGVNLPALYQGSRDVVYSRVILEAADKCAVHLTGYRDECGVAVFLNGANVLRIKEWYGWYDTDFNLVKGRNVLLFRSGARDKIIVDLQVRGTVNVSQVR